MSVKISLGNKKRTFKSIKLAAKESGIPYMTLYMRIRMGKTVAQDMKEPVRVYNKKELTNV